MQDSASNIKWLEVSPQNWSSQTQLAIKDRVLFFHFFFFWCHIQIHTTKNQFSLFLHEIQRLLGTESLKFIFLRTNIHTFFQLNNFICRPLTFYNFLTTHPPNINFHKSTSTAQCSQWGFITKATIQTISSSPKTSFTLQCCIRPNTILISSKLH